MAVQCLGRRRREKGKMRKKKKVREKQSARAVCALRRMPHARLSSLLTSWNTPRMSKFPEIQGGGSLILAWQVKSKHVVVIGGGEVSSNLHLQLYSSTNPSSGRRGANRACA
jgi:hypothetical protein